MNNSYRRSAARRRPGSGYHSKLAERFAALQIVLHKSGGRQADHLRPRRGQRRDAILAGAHPRVTGQLFLRIKDGPLPLLVLREEFPAVFPVIVFAAAEATRPACHRRMPHDVRLWFLPCIMTRGACRSWRRCSTDNEYCIMNNASQIMNNVLGACHSSQAE